MRGAMRSLVSVIVFFFGLICLPYVFAQSPEVSAEWALFDQILFIGIVVGLVVFGIMFYAIIRYREKPNQASA